jgi:hypothetical protein
MNPLEQLPYITIHAKRGTTTVPVLVDADYDGEWFAQTKWYVSKLGYVYSRRRNGSNQPQYLHHLVLPPKPGFWVSFKDRNKLNCRSCNLEYLTPKQNIAGRVAPSKTVKRDGLWSTPYRGVSRQGGIRNGKPFIGSGFTVNVAGRYIGSYPTAEMAARVFDTVARNHYGDRIRLESLNFPQETTMHPIRKSERDGIYARCVWCDGENYAPNVMAYSKGQSACHQCGKLLPPEYVTFKSPREETV